MGTARAEGTSGRSHSANPSAISLSLDRDLDRLASFGFDCSSPEARYVIERTTMHKLEPYLPIALDNARAASLVNGAIIEHGDPKLKEVHDLITYDRRVQVVILKYIGIFESQFRARYARLASVLHGDSALYEPACFIRRKLYDEAISSVKRELSKQARHNRSLARHMDENGRFPLNVAVEYISLGTLSKIYDNTKDRNVVDGVAESFNLNSAKARSWFKTIANVRNICAHFNPYVVRKQIPTVPLPMKGCELPNASPFYIFPMLERMFGWDGVESFGDVNLDYAGRMLSDMSAETASYAKMYIGTAMALGVPYRFVNPEAKTWKAMHP